MDVINCPWCQTTFVKWASELCWWYRNIWRVDVEYIPRILYMTRGLLLPRLGGAFDLRLAVSVPLPIVMGIFVLLWFQSRLT